MYIRIINVLNIIVIYLRKTISQILFTVKMLIILYCDIVPFNKCNMVSFVHYYHYRRYLWAVKLKVYYESNKYATNIGNIDVLTSILLF